MHREWTYGGHLIEGTWGHRRLSAYIRLHMGLKIGLTNVFIWLHFSFQNMILFCCSFEHWHLLSFFIPIQPPFLHLPFYLLVAGYTVDKRSFIQQDTNGHQCSCSWFGNLNEVGTLFMKGNMRSVLYIVRTLTENTYWLEIKQAVRADISGFYPSVLENLLLNIKFVFCSLFIQPEKDKKKPRLLQLFPELFVKVYITSSLQDVKIIKRTPSR